MKKHSLLNFYIHAWSFSKRKQDEAEAVERATQLTKELDFIEKTNKVRIGFPMMVQKCESVESRKKE